MYRPCLGNLHLHFWTTTHRYCRRHFLIPLAKTALLSLVSIGIFDVPIFLMVNFWISECPRGTLFEAYSKDTLANVGGIFSCQPPLWWQKVSSCHPSLHDQFWQAPVRNNPSLHSYTFYQTLLPPFEPNWKFLCFYKISSYSNIHHNCEKLELDPINPQWCYYFIFL